MSTTSAQINLWRSASSEHQRLEFKEAKNQFDNQRLYRYCVALANEGRGHLILGVADKPPRPVVGTAAFRDPVGMTEKLFQRIGNSFASVPRNARGCGVFRVGERCFSP
jgi:ATP-dependent DNA helicase RecG